MDKNGRLLLDPVEGMPIEEAMRIREMYSENVGTIVVVNNEAELKAALNDERIDFIYGTA